MEIVRYGVVGSLTLDWSVALQLEPEISFQTLVEHDAIVFVAVVYETKQLL